MMTLPPIIPRNLQRQLQRKLRFRLTRKMKRKFAIALLGFVLGMATAYLFTHTVIVNAMYSQLGAVTIAVCSVYRMIKKPDTAFAAGFLMGIFGGILLPPDLDPYAYIKDLFKIKQ